MSQSSSFKNKAPFWQSPWSIGERGGKSYRSCTIAPTRAERKTNAAVITIYDDAVRAMKPEQQKAYVAQHFMRAVKAIGLEKIVAGAMRVELLNGWMPDRREAKLITP